MRTTDRHDPLWEALFVQRLRGYLPYMKRFWDEIDSIVFTDTGTFDFPKYAENQPYMYYRCSRSPLQSAIRGLQVFPYIHAASLQDMPRIAGGMMACAKELFNPDKHYVLDNFVIQTIWNIPSFETSGVIFVFIPEEVFGGISESVGQWIFTTKDELLCLKAGVCSESLKKRLAKLQDD